MAVDTEGKLYNIEVQRADKGAGARRARYNLAMLDSHTLKKSDDFDALPETYIIFITENDLFGLGKPIYEVEKTFKGTDLPFDDGCTIIYVNGAYRGEDAIGRLMADFSARTAEEMHYAELAEKMRFHKQQTKGVEQVCRIVEEYGNERAAEALAKRNVVFAEKLLCDGSLSLEKIADIADLPLSQVQQIAQRLIAHA